MYSVFLSAEQSDPMEIYLSLSQMKPEGVNWNDFAQDCAVNLAEVGIGQVDGKMLEKFSVHTLL